MCILIVGQPLKHIIKLYYLIDVSKLDPSLSNLSASTCDCPLCVKIIQRCEMLACTVSLLLPLTITAL
jgi:hypothetical protein